MSHKNATAANRGKTRVIMQNADISRRAVPLYKEPVHTSTRTRYVSRYVCEMETAVGRTFYGEDEKTCLTTGRRRQRVLRRKGDRTMPLLITGHLNYSRISRAHNRSNDNEFESALRVVLYR